MVRIETLMLVSLWQWHFQRVGGISESWWVFRELGNVVLSERLLGGFSVQGVEWAFQIVGFFSESLADSLKI